MVVKTVFKVIVSRIFVYFKFSGNKLNAFYNLNCLATSTAKLLSKNLKL